MHLLFVKLGLQQQDIIIFPHLLSPEYLSETNKQTEKNEGNTMLFVIYKRGMQLKPLIKACEWKCIM